MKKFLSDNGSVPSEDRLWRRVSRRVLFLKRRQPQKITVFFPKNEIYLYVVVIMWFVVSVVKGEDVTPGEGQRIIQVPLSKTTIANHRTTVPSKTRATVRGGSFYQRPFHLGLMCRVEWMGEVDHGS